jgi:hypothetical protein
MYQGIRVSQETQHNQRPDQTNIILDQIAQQTTGGEQRFLQSHEGPDLAATSDLEKFCSAARPPCSSPLTEEKGGAA